MSYGGSSGGSGSLHTASDVALSNPQASNILQYNSSLQKWQNGTLAAAQIPDLTEAVQDIVASFLTTGSGVTLTYDDNANTLTIGFNGVSTGTGTGSSGGGSSTPAAVSITNLWKPVQQVNTYLNTHPELSPIAAQPQAKWVLGSETLADFNSMVSLAAGATIVLCVYAVPGRDSGGYSSGGFSSRSAYLSYIQTIVSGIGSAPIIVVLEPDALGLSNGFSSDAKAERIETLRQAVDLLAALPNAEVYVDASMWIGASDQANLLKAVDISKIAGFSLNVSSFNAQADCYTYGDNVVSALGSLGVSGKKYIIDSSRNGNGPLTSSFAGSDAWLNTSQPWCNPPGRAIGVVPGTVSSSHTSCRANLWVKSAGESDGAFPSLSQSGYFGESAPAAGTFWVAYARDILGYSPQVPGVPDTAKQFSNVVSSFTSWGQFTILSTNVSLVSGRARIPMTTAYESIQTASTWTLVSSSVYARLYPGAAASGSTSAQVSMVINSTSAGTRIRIVIDTKANTIAFESESSYYDQNAVSITYSATAHAFVRLREASGSLYFETSPDASTWTARRTISTPAWIHATADQSLQFFAYSDAGTNYAEIDNVNTTS